MKPLVLLVTTLVALPVAAQSHSVYTQRPDDPAAVTVEAPANASEDATGAIQSAIDRIAGATPSGQGIVFLPEGHYRLTHTLFVWPGVRVIGYGVHRPVLTLAPNTPGYQKDLGYMVFFAGGRPSLQAAASAGGTAGAFSGNGPADEGHLRRESGDFLLGDVECGL